MWFEIIFINPECLELARIFTGIHQKFSRYLVLLGDATKGYYSKDIFVLRTCRVGCTNADQLNTMLMQTLSILIGQLSPLPWFDPRLGWRAFVQPSNTVFIAKLIKKQHSCEICYYHYELDIFQFIINPPVANGSSRDYYSTTKQCKHVSHITITT